MNSSRLLAQLPLWASFVTLAAILIWANRAGAIKLLVASVVLSGLTIAYLGFTWPPTGPRDWPFWGTAVVVGVTVFGTALAAHLLPSRGMWVVLSLVLATIVAAGLYVGVYALLILLFPGRFWI